MSDAPERHTIRDQAEEVSLRVQQAQDLIDKRSGKIAAEMLAIMHHRLGILKAAEATMWWLVDYGDDVKAFLAGRAPPAPHQPSEAEAEAALELLTPAPPARRIFIINGVKCDEMGDPIEDGDDA